MKALLLAVHVLASVILIGPITVAASLFPRYAAAAAAEPDPRTAPARAAAAAMHRISRGYAVPAIAVPIFGIGLGAAMGVLAQTWLVVSMALTALAALVLAAWILPTQGRIMDLLAGEPTVADSPNRQRSLRLLSMRTGIFATLWAVVVVLMIVRPGSSTGV